MYLFRFYYLNILALLVFSCAQQGGISGGPRDNSAPKVEKLNPENKSTNFTQRSITYTFDEFIALNNPNENCIILPSGPKIKSSIHKKQLTLEIEGDLVANTTYQISLNALVKDTREGNDSLMKYVFSTGNFLDSISYQGAIVDAKSNEYLENITVALYKVGDSIQSKPLYFVKTDKKGVFKFEHLKPLNYQLYAFQDINKDLTFQVNEKVAFSDTLIHLETSIVDSMHAYRLFQNNPPKKVLGKQLFYPKMLNISASYPIQKSVFIFNNQELNLDKIFTHKEDSVSLFLPSDFEENNVLILKNEYKTDTVSFSSITKNNANKPAFFVDSKDISQKKELNFYFSDNIENLDTSKVFLLTKDSIKVGYSFIMKDNKIKFLFKDTIQQGFKISFKKGCLLFNNKESNDIIDLDVIANPQSNFGNLIFKNKFPENTLLEFLLKGKVTQTISSDVLNKNPEIKFLEPGEYSFRLILDENKNGKWDVGDVYTKIQAEKIIYYSEKTKIRANWETEVELEIKN